jgi:hypothetical protein
MLRRKAKGRSPGKIDVAAPKLAVVNRMKPRAGSPPTEQEKRFHAHLRGLGCYICGEPASIHHVTSDGFKRIARSHRRVVPLCPSHHQHDHGDLSVERLGHAGFTRYWGVDLLAVADQLWLEWEGRPGTT